MKIKMLLAVLACSLVSLSFSFTDHLCEGFLPENDLKIPIALQMLTGGGLDEVGFNKVLDQIESHYSPIVASKGGTLQVRRLWTDNTVNASAQRSGTTYIINMYGGLARHPEISADGFMLVACHEMGHHLAGAPKNGGWFGSWASNEGQSDYFAGLRCLRQIWTAEDNARFVQENQIDPVLSQKCMDTWNTQDEENLCIRTGAAGMEVTSLFRALREEETIPHFDTPDPRRVTRTDNSHPATQCRLDTYFQSGLCVHDMTQELSDTDVRVGTCTESQGTTLGVRPRCWYGESF